MGERKGWSKPGAEREKEKKRVQALRSLMIRPQILPQLSSLAEPDAPPASKKSFLDAPLERREAAWKGEEEGRCRDEGHRLLFLCLSLQDATLRFSWARSAEVWHQKFITQRSQASVSDIKQMS